MKVTILGCGASAGVPVIGCDCAVCSSENEKNKRTRASALFETDTGARILIDASPDLRMQALRCGISQVDACIITHAHADHCHGLDDMRAFNFHKDEAIDLYTDAQTMQELRERFAYAFAPHREEFGWYKPLFRTHEVARGVQHLCIAGQEVTLFSQHHGHGHSLGVRMGNIAYSTDVNALDEEAFAVLDGLDYWVVDCLRYRQAPTHAHLELTLSWIERVRPKMAVLTHMSHEIDYDSLSAELPAHICLAYDGLVLGAGVA